MIEDPGIGLEVEQSADWVFQGPLAARLERIIEKLRGQLLESGITLPPARLTVLSAPEEHVGLGVGTQLSIAVARAVLKLAALADPGVDELARITGRGARSGIGLHGSHHGGLIVDGGRNREGEVPPLVARADFPDDWTILIVVPPGSGGLHGSDERQAFDRLPPISRSAGDALCRIVLLEILPAVIEHDLEAFGAALSELQERVGAAFAPVQGGIYASAQSALIATELKHMGLLGTGQSSWGPTIYAFSESPRPEVERLAERLRARLGLPRSSIFCTRAANREAVLECGS
jgi:beta-RFAP synthase